MVVSAILSTNIRNTIQNDEIDQYHGIRYDRDLVIVKDNGDRGHFVDKCTGGLFLHDIQCPDYPVVQALASNYRFVNGVFSPIIIPTEYNCFPTLFELERIARG